MDLRHENILPLYGFRSGPDEDLLVSPWCPNGDLADYLDANRNLDLMLRLDIVSSEATHASKNFMSFDLFFTQRLGK